MVNWKNEMNKLMLDWPSGDAFICLEELKQTFVIRLQYKDGLSTSVQLEKRTREGNWSRRIMRLVPVFYTTKE